MTQNWRTQTDAADYFGQQRKQLDVADRRPVIRKASDLVGPGINSSAIPVNDLNNLLATYNGYYSAIAATPNAPTNAENFVGHTIMDADLGGTQTFTGLASGKTYIRTFSRNPSNVETIYWRAWKIVGGADVGVITGFAGGTPPDGWLLCNGGSFLASAYPALFAIIGTTYGGSSGNFNVPDLRDRAMYGAGSAWYLGDSDGLSIGARTKLLAHNHNITNELAHSHTIGTEGNHQHTITPGGSHQHSIAAASISTASNTGTGGSGNRLTNGETHTHGGQTGDGGVHDHGSYTGGGGNHNHAGFVGGNGAHSHGGSTANNTVGSLRGVGVNMIIRFA